MSTIVIVNIVMIVAFLVARGIKTQREEAAGQRDESNMRDSNTVDVTKLINQKAVKEYEQRGKKLSVQELVSLEFSLFYFIDSRSKELGEGYDTLASWCEWLISTTLRMDAHYVNVDATSDTSLIDWQLDLVSRMPRKDYHSMDDETDRTLFLWLWTQVLQLEETLVEHGYVDIDYGYDQSYDEWKLNGIDFFYKAPYLHHIPELPLEKANLVCMIEDLLLIKAYFNVYADEFSDDDLGECQFFHAMSDSLLEMLLSRDGTDLTLDHAAKSLLNKCYKEGMRLIDGEFVHKTLPINAEWCQEWLEKTGITGFSRFNVQY